MGAAKFYAENVYVLFPSLKHRKTLETKGFVGLDRPFLDSVLQTPHPPWVGVDPCLLSI